MRIARSVLILLAGAAMAPLAACKVDNRPLLARMEGPPPPAQYAALPQPGGPYEAPPPGGYYPSAPPPAQYGGYRRIRYEPERAWPYAEEAYALDRTFYDVPPDYGFYYGDEQPWVWETADDSLMFAEPYGDAYRFYYYEPGATWPYFVADPNYGYAFDQSGDLIALFDAAGALLAGDSYDRYYPSAYQYWTRGLDLRQAYGRTPRYQVAENVWSQRAPFITRYEEPWIRAGDTQPAWRDWRARSGQDFVQRFAPERQRRVAMAAVPGAGNHLGWEQGRHVGWRNGGGPPMLRGGGMPGGREMRLAEARAPVQMRPAPQQRFEAPRGRGHEGRGGPAMAFSAGQASHQAMFRGPEARGWRGGPPEQRFAAAQAPQPRFHGNPHAFEGGGAPGQGRGGWHGGGGGGPPAQHFAQAQPQPQPAPQQSHGNPHQGGGGGGGGQGHGGGNPHQGGGGGGQDHGHGHGG